jgi:predicted transcriptional regulator
VHKSNHDNGFFVAAAVAAGCCCWLLLLLQGCVNNTTAGRMNVTFKFPGAIVPSQSTCPGYEVHVSGSFTDWQVTIPLTQGPDGDYYAKVALTVSSTGTACRSNLRAGLCLGCRA